MNNSVPVKRGSHILFLALMTRASRFFLILIFLILYSRGLRPSSTLSDSSSRFVRNCCLWRLRGPGRAPWLPGVNSGHVTCCWVPADTHLGGQAMINVRLSNLRLESKVAGSLGLSVPVGRSLHSAVGTVCWYCTC